MLGASSNTLPHFCTKGSRSRLPYAGWKFRTGSSTTLARQHSVALHPDRYASLHFLESVQPQLIGLPGVLEAALGMRNSRGHLVAILVQRQAHCKRINTQLPNISVVITDLSARKQVQKSLCSK